MPASLEARYDQYDSEARAGVSHGHFTVYDLTGSTPEPIGQATLEIDPVLVSAEFSIKLGQRRGEGLGTEASRLALDWAFHIAGLRNVWLRVMALNRAAVRAYEKAGFKVIGARRNGSQWLGKVCDELFMDAIPDEFGESVVLAHLCPQPSSATNESVYVVVGELVAPRGKIHFGG